MTRALRVLVLLALVSVQGYAQEINPGPVQEPEGGTVTTADGVRLYFQKVGSGRTTVILPAHLFTFEDFRRLAHHITLISYDMRNRGRSDPVTDGEKITIQADVEDLETVRRHFKVEKFTPIGYSYLGLMVVLYAMKYPDRVERIIQLGPMPLTFGTEYQPEFTMTDQESVLETAGVKRLRKLRDENFHLAHPKEYCEEEWQVTRFLLVGDPSKVERLPGDICSMPNEWPTNLARHLQHHFVESIQKLDIPREEVSQVSHPVLIIHGTKDRNAPYGAGREWAYLLPNARLLTVKGAAHQIFAEAPETVFPAIEAFLDGQWPSHSERVSAHPRKPQPTRDQQPK
jgi:proline iminopeptidase